MQEIAGVADRAWADTPRSTIEARFIGPASNHLRRSPLRRGGNREMTRSTCRWRTSCATDILSAFDDLIRAVRHMESHESESNTWN